MTSDRYNLRSMSDNDLHEWLIMQKPGSEEYHAGEEESLRRVALIEQRIEQAEKPSRKREFTAILMAMIALATIIIFTIMSY